MIVVGIVRIKMSVMRMKSKIKELFILALTMARDEGMIKQEDVKEINDEFIIRVNSKIVNDLMPKPDKVEDWSKDIKHISLDL